MRMLLILGSGIFVIILAVALTATSPADAQRRAEGQEWAKKECARLIVEATGHGKSRDEAEAMVRGNPRAKIVCAGLEMNGVKVIE